MLESSAAFDPRSDFAPASKSKHQPNNDRNSSASNKPHRAIGWVSGKGSRNIGPERMRLIKTKNQQHDPEDDDGDTYHRVHFAMFARTGDCVTGAFPFQREIVVGL